MNPNYDQNQEYIQNLKLFPLARHLKHKLRLQKETLRRRVLFFREPCTLKVDRVVLVICFIEKKKMMKK